MGNCKDCRHWKEPEVPYGGAAGKCCLLTFNPSGMLGKHPPDMVIENRQIYVSPNFGCVHFEEREEGPFKVVPSSVSHSLWNIEYDSPNGELKLIGWRDNFRCAERTADWLNEPFAKSCDCRS